MKRFLVDSDVLIWHLGGREKELKLLQKLSKRGDLYISVVTIAEVRAGLTEDTVRTMQKLKESFKTVPITDDIAEIAGALRQKYKLEIADMLIAASAILTDSILLTYNKKHFPMPQIKLL